MDAQGTYQFVTPGEVKFTGTFEDNEWVDYDEQTQEQVGMCRVIRSFICTQKLARTTLLDSAVTVPLTLVVLYVRSSRCVWPGGSVGIRQEAHVVQGEVVMSAGSYLTHTRRSGVKGDSYPI